MGCAVLWVMEDWVWEVVMHGLCSTAGIMEDWVWEVMHGLCSTVGNGGLGVGGDAWAVQYCG